MKTFYKTLNESYLNEGRENDEIVKKVEIFLTNCNLSKKEKEDMIKIIDLTYLRGLGKY